MWELGESCTSRLVQSVVEAARWPPRSGPAPKVEILVVEDAAVQRVIAAYCTEPVESTPLATLLLIGRGAYESRLVEAFDSGRLAERIVLAATATGLVANVRTLSAEGRKLVKDALGVVGERRISNLVVLSED